MKNRLPSLSTLTYIAMGVVPLAVLIGLVVLMLRAQPAARGLWGARGKAHAAPRPPMAGEPYGVNQLGDYAGEGVVGPVTATPPRKPRDRPLFVRGTNFYPLSGPQATPPTEAQEHYEQFARGLILPEVNFRDVPFRVALRQLRELSQSADPKGAGIWIDAELFPADREVDLVAQQISFMDALQRMVRDRELDIAVWEGRLALLPRSPEVSQLMKEGNLSRSEAEAALAEKVQVPLAQ